MYHCHEKRRKLKQSLKVMNIVKIVNIKLWLYRVRGNVAHTILPVTANRRRETETVNLSSIPLWS